MKYFFTLLLLYSQLTGYSQSDCFSAAVLDPANFDMMAQRDSFYNAVDAYVSSFKGCDVPEFDVTDIKGHHLSSKSLHGKVVFLNFWFTHCHPCVMEFGSLNKLAKDYGNDVVFISFAIDQKPALDSFLVKHPLNYYIIPASDSIIRGIFKVMSFPTNIIIGRNWRVAAIAHGVQKNDGLGNYKLFAPMLETAIKKKE